jgi:hypothetical protein
MSKQVLRIVVDNGTPKGETIEFPLEKVRSIEVVKRLWSRVQNYVFGSDPTIDSLESVQHSIDDFVQSENKDNTKSTSNEDDEEKSLSHVERGKMKMGVNNHCTSCGASGHTRKHGKDYCVVCDPNKREHKPLTAEQRHSFAQKRLSLVGTKAEFPDGTEWDVIEWITGSQYRVQRNQVDTKSSRWKLGTARKVTKYASHSTRNGWRDWEVR